MPLFVRHTAILAAVSLAVGTFTAEATAQPTLESLYQAAKAAGEAQVTVYGAPSVELRAALAKGFGERFPDIELAYSGMPAPQVYPKMSAEVRAGVPSADVILSGPSSIAINLKGNGLVQPVDKFVVVREALDGSKWMGGAIAYGDDDRTMLAMTTQVTLPVIVNRDLVKPGEVQGDTDLMNPKWKGKIIAGDPVRPGGPQQAFRRLYDLHGADWLRKLIIDQEVAFTANLRQLVDVVAKGTYAIAIGADSPTTNSYIAKGAPLRLGAEGGWRDKLIINTGYGSLAVANKLQHPAAAKLFINWILTQEGQTSLGTGLSYSSRRLDVDVAGIPDSMKPKEGVAYIEAYKESFVRSTSAKEMVTMIKNIVAGAQHGKQ